MPLSYLFDENLRGPLWNFVLRHNRSGLNPIDVVQIGDSDVLALGTGDAEILLWAQRHGRILVSVDRGTMSKHLADHLAAGHHSPGVFTVRTEFPLREILDFLVLAAFATDPSEWADTNRFIP